MMKKLTLIFDLTFKVIVLFLSISFGIAFLFVGAKAALAANIKPVTIVEGGVVTVGDVFTDISEEKAGQILAGAPQPGQDIVLNAAMLKRIAVAMDIPWRPATISDQVVVRSAATVVGPEYLEKKLREHLDDLGTLGKFSIAITGMAPQIILPANKPAHAELETLKFDYERDIFEASFKAPSIQDPVSQLTITGKIDRLLDVPVLSRTTRAGELIGKPDLKWVEISSSKIQKDTLLYAEDILGMTPRRVIEQGRPLKENDLQAPILVGRGDDVILRLQSGSLELTAKGRALQNGAKGDLVRVVNDNSSRSIEGIVTGDREVTIAN
jgi:flagella basal body P-ring formation protein FlgA